MRRKEREITDLMQIEEMMKECDCCRLGFTDGQRAYIVPLNFGYQMKEGKLTLYFHCAMEGRKMEMMKVNPNVCFEMDSEHKIIDAPQACGWTMYYSSVMGSGTLRKAETDGEKIAGLTMIMNQCGHEGEPAFNPKVLEHTQVLVLECDEVTAKHQGS